MLALLHFVCEYILLFVSWLHNHHHMTLHHITSGMHCHDLQSLILTSCLSIIGEGLVSVGDMCKQIRKLSISKCKNLQKFAITKLFVRYMLYIMSNVRFSFSTYRFGLFYKVIFFDICWSTLTLIFFIHFTYLKLYETRRIGCVILSYYLGWRSEIVGTVLPPHDGVQC